MQLASTNEMAEKVMPNVVAVNNESTIQFVEGFKPVMEQVKVMVGDVNLDVVGPFKGVMNSEIMEAHDWSVG